MRAPLVSVPATLLAIVLVAAAQSFGVASVGFAKVALTSSSAPGANSIASVDVNGDGIPDLIIATNQGVTVVFGNGDGTFGPPEGATPVTYSTAGEYSESVAVVDINGDGLPDIIVTNMCLGTFPGCNGGAVLLNGANGTPGNFSSAVPFNSGGQNTGAVAVGDVNGDGIPDLVLTSGCSVYTCVGGVLTWLPGNGDGTFGAAKDIAGVTGPVAIGALNPNSGVLDLVTTAGVLMNDGSGNFTPLSGNVVNGANSIVLVDINNDGILDVVAALGTGYVAAALGNGDGTFQPAQNFKTTGYFPLSVAVADVNGDGNPDVAVAVECTTVTAAKVCSGAGAVSVLAGNGNGTFQTAVSFASGGDITTSVQVVDANLDGKPDVWVANACGTSLTCTGNGSAGVLLNDFTVHTTMKITSSVNPALINQNVTLTATIGPSTSSVPNGTDIVFTDAGNYIGDNVTVNGVTSITYAFPAAGPQAIQASFGGDLYHSAVTGALSEVIDKVPSMTALASSLNNSTYGQSVMLVATVSSNLATPTGKVTFKNGTALLGTVVLDGTGTATLTLTTLPAGTLSISAAYGGDFETLASNSASIMQTVNQATSNTALTSSINPSTDGRSVEFIATVTSPTTTPTGTVTFYYGTTALNTVNLSKGVAAYSIASLPMGNDNITAVYNGTTNIVGSTSNVVVQTVNVN